MPDPNEVKTYLKGYLRQKLASKGVELEDQLNLIDAGLIDSFGLLDLVSAVERKFGVQMDMDQIDLESFTTVGGFVKTVSEAG